MLHRLVESTVVNSLLVVVNIRAIKQSLMSRFFPGQANFMRARFVVAVFKIIGNLINMANRRLSYDPLRSLCWSLQCSFFAGAIC